jgi:hypothetical protein
MKPERFLPPPVLLSDEEPMAAGGWRTLSVERATKRELEINH